VASGRLDFPQTILRIAEAIPACGLVAVGPHASDATWQRLAERAFVRKPLLAPVSALPVDRGALAAFEPPADPDAYVAAAIALAADPGSRAAHARAARDAVLAQHCGDGWGRRLEALQQALPRQHDVGLAFEPPPMPPSLAAYWAGIHAGKAQQSPLDYAQVRARENGLHARLDVAVLDAMRQWPH
jgi:hypothetical protein